LTPSTRSLQIRDEILPSFAVSTLVPFLGEHSPNAERFIFPLCFTFEPKRRWFSVGHPFIHLVGALSGKRGLTRCELKWPSFGCLKLWTS